MGDRLRRFIITESEADLTSHAGLGLIGMALNERTDLAIGCRGGIAIAQRRHAPRDDPLELYRAAVSGQE